MSQAAVHGTLASNSIRTRALIIPREHGAWGILLIPLITGAAVGAGVGHGWAALALFSVLALSLFWLRTPLESWVGAGPMRTQTAAETHAVILAAALIGGVAALAATALLWGGKHRGLLLLGAVSAAAFLAQAALKAAGRPFRMAAQIIGSIGLTSTAPAAYYVLTGRLDSRAVALWLANWIFAGDQVHFVQLRIRAARLTEGRDKLARGRVFLAGQLIMSMLLIAAWRYGILPGLAVLAFVPILIRGFLWFVPGPQPLAVKRLGWTELAHAATFGVLLVAGFLL